MERLQAHQDQLSQWLSADSGHILEECGDILSVNELKRITRQPEEEQMRLLLKLIISKGANACEALMDILRRNQARNHQLQHFFTSCCDDSGFPWILADGSSVVTCRTMRNVDTKTLTCSVETVSSAGGNQAVHNSGPSASVARIEATGSSVVVADRLDGVKAGTINFSVNMNPSLQVPSASGPADDLFQSPAGRTIREKKVKLLETLMSDADFVLQLVHQGSIVSHRRYQNLRFSSGPQETVTQILDLVLSKGPGKCGDFLQLLTEPEVLDTFPPLRDILDISDQS